MKRNFESSSPSPERLRPTQPIALEQQNGMKERALGLVGRIRAYFDGPPAPPIPDRPSAAERVAWMKYENARAALSKKFAVLSFVLNALGAASTMGYILENGKASAEDELQMAKTSVNDPRAILPKISSLRAMSVGKEYTEAQDQSGQTAG